MTAGRSIGARDQAASTFSAILMRLCDATDALAAALVDREGETVDYSGVVDPFDIKVAAAELGLVIQAFGAAEARSSGDLRELRIRSTGASYVVRCLTEGYAIVLCLQRRRLLVSKRALAEAVRETCIEAGLAPPTTSGRLVEQWLRVEVDCEPNSRRPVALWGDGEWLPLEILGRCAEGQLVRRELGFQVRTPDGAEFTLVREPLGRWYADNAAAVRR